MRPRAAQAAGDERINPFGVGGEIEIRSGMLVQKQLITGPLLHFGLGEQTGVDVVRVVWPNGTVRAEFEVKADQEIVTEQRLKGSCPFLLLPTESRWCFVRCSALGFGNRFTDQHARLGEYSCHRKWYRIGRDQLAPRRILRHTVTADLWRFTTTTTWRS